MYRRCVYAPRNACVFTGARALARAGVHVCLSNDDATCFGACLIKGCRQYITHSLYLCACVCAHAIIVQQQQQQLPKQKKWVCSSPELRVLVCTCTHARERGGRAAHLARRLKYDIARRHAIGDRLKCVRVCASVACARAGVRDKLYAPNAKPHV